MSSLIFTNPQSIRPGRKGPPTAEIWVVLGGMPFPEPHWNDFAVVIIEAWIVGALRLLRGSGLERVHFMDGPYLVEMTSAGLVLFELRALERTTLEKAR